MSNTTTDGQEWTLEQRRAHVALKTAESAAKIGQTIEDIFGRWSGTPTVVYTQADHDELVADLARLTA